jgi:cytosine/adenosine deaminase-related metal-dependent hydrolase
MDRGVEEAMTLAGARVSLNATESVATDLTISNGRVKSFGATNRGAGRLDLEGSLILPGLINAHDHLEFNLFPRLGRGPYTNSNAWAEDVYRPHEPPIRQHLQVPKRIRFFWGGIKNLLAGVTSVSHHNPYQPGVFEHRFPVRVIKRFGWAHSLKFCSDLKERFARTPPGFPFIIHAGEGWDAQARLEIHQLEKMGVLGPSTVIVHGVALESEELRLVKRRSVSVVWCPSSNCFTLDRTLSSEVIQSNIPIALGSDSALTAAGDFVDELRFAHRYVDLSRLYRMATTEAARILRLNAGEGDICPGRVADLVVVKDEGQSPAEALLSLRPELILVNGRIKLFSPGMADRLKLWSLPGFEAIELEGRGRWFIECRVSVLLERAKRVLGEDFRLAGKKVIH